MDDRYITEELVRKLSLPRYHQCQTISLLGNNSGGISEYRTSFYVPSVHGEFSHEMTAAVTQGITSKLPSSPVMKKFLGLAKRFEFSRSFTCTVW